MVKRIGRVFHLFATETDKEPRQIFVVRALEIKVNGPVLTYAD